MGDYHTKNVKKICETKLGIVFRKAKEFNGWYLLEGKKKARITVPKGRKTIPPKTFKSMANQLKLSTDDFERLLNCPLSADGYKKILIEQD